LLLTTPYYSKPPQGIFRHFEAIATAFYPLHHLQHPRPHVSTCRGHELRIAQLPNIIGVKEASGDLEMIARIIEEAPPSIAFGAATTR
jgi:4-hydroxy-tetrahydrodipicolinate synthase